MFEIILLTILLLSGLGAYFISVEVKRRLVSKGNGIARFLAGISFFASIIIIGFILSYVWLAIGAMCDGR
ncbi:MAG TPA: hypothetical protein VK796_06285 [Cytophaga sp.]|nr:hypothetical protein [Cytophaga sp.]